MALGHAAGWVVIIFVGLISSLSIYSLYLAPSPNQCQPSCGASSLQSTLSRSTFALTANQTANQTVGGKASPPPMAYGNASLSSSSSESMSTSSASLSSSSTSSSTTAAAFSYAPNPQVKILSVQASVSGNETGSQGLTFSVQFENVGNETIYVAGGGASSLDATVPANSGVEKVLHKETCLLPSAMVPVGPNQNYAASTPGCWNAFSYIVLEPGEVQVQLTLSWSAGLSPGGMSGALTILAEFDVN